LTDHPYETCHAIYARALGLLGPVEENDAMAAGTDAEFMMPARARRLRPRMRLVKSPYFYVDPMLRFGATPDFVDAANGGLWQAKCVDPLIFNEQWREGPPLWVQLQLQAEMLATGVTHGGVLVLVRDRLFTTELYDMEAHEGAQAAILRAVAAMKKRVDEEDPPPADYMADADSIIGRLQFSKSGTSIDLTGDNRMMECVAEYVRLGELGKEHDKLRKAYKAEIMEKMGDADKAICGDFSISAGMIEATEIKAYTRRGYRNFQINERKQ
jgi:hypothetical protein